MFSRYLEFRTMDIVHKPINSECHTPSLEPFTEYTTLYPKRQQFTHQAYINIMFNNVHYLRYRLLSSLLLVG
jgi:hypothetical protein